SGINNLLMKLFSPRAILILLLIFSFSGCDNSSENREYTSEEIEQETAKLNNFFEEEFQKELEDSPMLQTRLGIKTNYDSWDDFSHLRHAEDLNKAKRRLDFLKNAINAKALEGQELLRD